MSLSNKVITVFGADTPAGAVVAHTLSKSCKVRAVPLGGEALIPTDVEIIVCKVSSEDDLTRAAQGAHGCFIHTVSNFGYEDFMVKEQTVGYNIAAACRNARVPHVIFCTQQHTGDFTQQHTGDFTQQHAGNLEHLYARHMVVKSEMEEYFLADRADHQRITTLLELPCFYEEIFGSLAPTWEGGGEIYQYRLDWPYVDGQPVEVPMMSVEDVGPVIELIFNNPKDFLGDFKKVWLLGDRVTGEELTKQINTEVKDVSFREEPVELTYHFYQDKDSSHSCPWNNDLANMYKFFWKKAKIEGDKYDTIVAVTKKLNPAVLNLAQWMKKNKHDLHLALKSVHPRQRLHWWLALVYKPQNREQFEYYH